MVDFGLAASAALAIGLGLLPVICGFASLRLPERRGEPAYRAFAAFLAASIALRLALHGHQGRLPLDGLLDA